jgi:hypothetical protein
METIFVNNSRIKASKSPEITALGNPEAAGECVNFYFFKNNLFMCKDLKQRGVLRSIWTTSQVKGPKWTRGRC